MKWIRDTSFFGTMVIIIIVVGVLGILQSYTETKTVHCLDYIESETQIIGQRCDRGVEVVVITR